MLCCLPIANATTEKVDSLENNWNWNISFNLLDITQQYSKAFTRMKD